MYAKLHAAQQQQQPGSRARVVDHLPDRAQEEAEAQVEAEAAADAPQGPIVAGNFKSFHAEEGDLKAVGDPTGAMDEDQDMEDPEDARGVAKQLLDVMQPAGHGGR